MDSRKKSRISNMLWRSISCITTFAEFIKPCGSLPLWKRELPITSGLLPRWLVYWRNLQPRRRPNLSRPLFSRLWDLLGDVLFRNGHSRWPSIPANIDSGAHRHPQSVSLARLFLLELRSFYQRMRSARERLGQPRQIEFDVLCQSCAEAGYRCCHRNAGRCILHIQELRLLYPWIGWPEMALLAQTWKAALDTACCNLDSAKTLQENHRSAFSGPESYHGKGS